MPSEPDPIPAAAAGKRLLIANVPDLDDEWDKPFGPFCSLTWRLIDLGVWLDERHVVRGDDPGDVR